MKTVIRKWFWVWDFEKEEEWLNEMSSIGLQLDKVGYCKYTFSKGRPGEYNYRLELLNNTPTHQESKEYISFLEDTNIEHIDNLFRWAYFRKKTSEGPFTIFSDNDSKINHLKRISNLIAFVGFFNLIACFSNLHILFIEYSKFNGTSAIMSLTLCSLLLYGYLRINEKIKYLKKQKSIYE